MARPRPVTPGMGEAGRTHVIVGLATDCNDLLVTSGGQRQVLIIIVRHCGTAAKTGVENGRERERERGGKGQITDYCRPIACSLAPHTSYLCV